MARLTEDLNGYYGKAEQYIDCDDRAWVGAVIEKLGRLEDIEEELGCPLEVVFRAFKIIKDKNVDTFYLTYCFNCGGLDRYNRHAKKYHIGTLNKQEFNTLKETLGGK